jgi:hypothetical protein
VRPFSDDFLTIVLVAQVCALLLLLAVHVATDRVRSRRRPSNHAPVLTLRRVRASLATLAAWQAGIAARTHFAVR